MNSFKTTFNSSLDSSQKSDEGLGQFTSSKSSHILSKLSEEDKVETFDSEVTLGPFSERSEHVSLPKVINDSDFKDPSIKRLRATENWRLLLHKLGEKKASLPKEEPSSQTIEGNAVLENRSASDTLLQKLNEPSSKERAITHWRRMCSEISKRQHGVRGREAVAKEQEPSPARPCMSSHKHLGLDRMPSSSSDSTTRKAISNLRRELFSLPPQQSCVVREEPPKFAQGLLKDRYSDLCWQQHNGLISVDISPNTSSSFAEPTRRNTSQTKRRATKGKVSTSGDEIPAKAAKGKKSPSISSGSTGRQFPNFRQRQQELHRYRVLIEQRRLDLLELRIAREREEAKQYMILFQKKMRIKEYNGAYDCSNI